MLAPDRRYPDRSGFLPEFRATLTRKDVVFIYTGQGGQGGQGIFAQKLFRIFPPPFRVLNIFSKCTLTTLTTLDIVDKYRELSGQGSCWSHAVTPSTLTSTIAPTQPLTDRFYPHGSPWGVWQFQPGSSSQSVQASDPVNFDNLNIRPGGANRCR